MNRKAYDKATDHALMEMVKEGDDPAFQQIVRRYKDPLTNYIYRIVNDYDTALDISQEVFIRVYRNAGQYKPLAAFSTWIFKIATNLSINEIRRRRKNYTISIFTKLKDYENEQTELPIPDSDAKTPEEQIIKKQVRNRVREALNSLPVKYRIPLLLRELAGHSYEEISAIINIPQGTVKSRINRGRLILKKKMLILQY
ncbi:sigma-70 family RNA polymerase sigma factor [bacterium]|nr:sigma-70 family RNA polymerase sigma factor [bacterium]